jgi:hypothetical protein
MLVRTWSRDSSDKIKQNPTKTWHYIFAANAPRPQQNQWVMSPTQAKTVEDGFGWFRWFPGFLGHPGSP